MSNSHVQSAKAIAEDIAYLCCVPDDWRLQISNLAAWPCPTVSLRSGAGFVGFWVYHSSRHRLLDSFHDDALAGRESLQHDPALAHAFAGHDGASQNFILRVDRQHRLQSLQFLHGPLRNENRVLAIFDAHPQLSELAGEKRSLGIQEHRLKLDGSRLGIDLVDRVLDTPVMWIEFTVGKDQLQRIASIGFLLFPPFIIEVLTF